MERYDDDSIYTGRVLKYELRQTLEKIKDDLKRKMHLTWENGQIINQIFSEYDSQQKRYGDTDTPIGVSSTLTADNNQQEVTRACNDKTRKSLSQRHTDKQPVDNSPTKLMVGTEKSKESIGSAGSIPASDKGFIGCIKCYKRKKDCKCIFSDFHRIYKRAYYYLKFKTGGDNLICECKEFTLALENGLCSRCGKKMFKEGGDNLICENCGERVFEKDWHFNHIDKCWLCRKFTPKNKKEKLR